MATRGRPRIGETKMSSAERKRRWDRQIRNADGEVPGQPARKPVVVYLREEAREHLRRHRELASRTELPTLLDSELIEASLLSSGLEQLQGSTRVDAILKHVQWLEAKLGHYQSMYLHSRRNHTQEDLKVRKQWFQQTVMAVLGGEEKSDTLLAREVAQRCEAAIRRGSGYESRNLAIDLGAVLRQEMEFEARDEALADRICSYVNRVLGV